MNPRKLLIRAGKNGDSASSRGFSYIELIVVIAIISVISGTVLVNMRKGNQTRDLKIGADGLSSAMRLLQNNILSGVPYEPNCGASSYSLVVPNLNVGDYWTYVSKEGACGNATRQLEALKLPSHVLFSRITVDGVNATSLNSVGFYPPFGEVRIGYNGNAPAKNRRAVIELIYEGTAFTRIVEVDGISGRISVR